MHTVQKNGCVVPTASRSGDRHAQINYPGASYQHSLNKVDKGNRRSVCVLFHFFPSFSGKIRHFIFAVNQRISSREENQWRNGDTRRVTFTVHDSVRREYKSVIGACALCLPSLAAIRVSPRASLCPRFAAIQPLGNDGPTSVIFTGSYRHVILSALVLLRRTEPLPATR